MLISSPRTSGLSSYLPPLNLVLSNKAVKQVLPASELLRIYNTSQGERYYFISWSDDSHKTIGYTSISITTNTSKR